MFRCRVCQEKDARIADLKTQIAYLSRLATPDNSGIPLVHLEADAILSGSQEIIEVDQSKVDETISERDRLLSGTYC